MRTLFSICYYILEIIRILVKNIIMTKSEIIRKGSEFYDSIETFEERMALSDEFGHKDVADREFKFYQWLCKNKIEKK